MSCVVSDGDCGVTIYYWEECKIVNHNFQSIVVLLILFNASNVIMDTILGVTLYYTQLLCKLILEVFPLCIRSGENRGKVINPVPHSHLFPSVIIIIIITWVSECPFPGRLSILCDFNKSLVVSWDVFKLPEMTFSSHLLHLHRSPSLEDSIRDPAVDRPF